MTPAVLGLYGPSGSGKTTWLVSLLPQLRARGLAAETVKTCHHDPEIEPTRKDSARHLSAGAGRTLLLSPGKRAVVSPRLGNEEDEIQAFVRESKADLVVVEGARGAAWPKVAVLATDRTWNLPLAFPLLGRVGSPPGGAQAPDWRDSSQAAEGIAEWIETRRSARGVLGLVLAGGEGKRLGGVNKARLCVGGITLAERAARNLGVYLERVSLCGPKTQRLAGLDIPVLADAVGVAGPAGGLLAGLAAAETGVLVLAVDQIGVTPGTIGRILWAGSPAALSEGGRLIPTVSFFPASSRAACEAAVREGERSLGGLLARLGARSVAALPGEEADIDERADLLRHGVRGE